MGWAMERRRFGARHRRARVALEVRAEVVLELGNTPGFWQWEQR